MSDEHVLATRLEHASALREGVVPRDVEHEVLEFPALGEGLQRAVHDVVSAQRAHQLQPV